MRATICSLPFSACLLAFVTVTVASLFLSHLHPSRIFVTAQINNDYLSVVMSSVDECDGPRAMVVDQSNPNSQYIVHAICDSSLVRANIRSNGTVDTTSIDLSDRCGATVGFNRAIALDERSGTAYVSCSSEIFSIDSNGVQTNITSSNSLLAFPFQLALHPHFPGILFATCSSGVASINLTDSSIDWLLPYCGPSYDLKFYDEGGHDMLVATCPEVTRFNLTDRTVLKIAPNQCKKAVSVAIDSRSGTLFASCEVPMVNTTQVHQIFSIAPSQANATSVANHMFVCDAEIAFDEQTGILYAICADNSPEVVAVIDGRVIPLVTLNQCGSPQALLLVPGGLLVACMLTSGVVPSSQGNPSAIIRISSSTVSPVTVPDACSFVFEIFADPETQAMLYRCKDAGLWATRNTDVVSLASEADCPHDSASPMTKQHGYIIVNCGSNLLIVDLVAQREVMLYGSRFGCTQISNFHAHPTDRDILFLSCPTTGIYAFNFSSNSISRIIDATPCGYLAGFDVNFASNSIYFACATQGLLKLDLTSQSVEVVANTTYCPLPSGPAGVYVTSSGVAYTNCLFNISALHPYPYVVAVNGAVATSIHLGALCSRFFILGSSSTTDSIILLCASTFQNGPSVIAFNSVATFPKIITFRAQCSLPWFAHQDAASLATWISCSDAGVIVSTTGFRCQPGFEWTSSGTCTPCARNMFRPFDGKAFGQCLPCASGFVTDGTSSTSCKPCMAGSYDSDKYCLLCPSGKYQNVSGANFCIDCDAGFYTDKAGSTACTPCPAGLYSSVNGSSSCLVCNSGSASNVIGRNRPCDGCPAGFYQAGLGQTSCLSCPTHFFSEQANSTSCTRCPNQVTNNQTACEILVCPPNWQLNEDIEMCEPCPLTQFSSRGGKCSPCPYLTYTPGLGSGCSPCDARGLICAGGVISSAPGFWAFPSPTRNWVVFAGNDNQDIWPLYDTVACPLCPGTALQQLNSSFADSAPTVFTYCTFPRVNSASNTLCALCESEYIPWGSSCVKCDGSNGPLIFGYLVLSFCIVLFLLYSSSSTASAGAMSIFLFFVQTASLELGPIARYIDWIAFANLDSKSSASCIAPWSPYDQTLFALLAPLILIGELIIVACVHYCLRLCMVAQAGAGNMDSSNRVIRLVNNRILRFSWSEYGAGAMAILLFCYTQVATASILYLDCMDVGLERLNFSSPSIDCRSSEYQRYLGAVLLAIIVYIIGLPIIAFVMLWRKRKTLSEPAAASAAIQNGNHQSASSTAVAPPTVEVNAWFPFYVMYHRRAFYWQCWVLLRRAAFVVIAVLLTQEPSERYMLFAFLHFASLLLHSYAQPYESEQLNRMETVSYVLLIIISQLLTGYLAPYPLRVQLLLFFLIVPPAMWMFGSILIQRYQQLKQWRLDRAKGASASPPSNSHINGNVAPPASSIPVTASDSPPSQFDVELSAISSHSIQGVESILPANATDSEQTTL